MPPAARITDMHTCPMVTGVVPHVGGPIIKGQPNVLTCKLPQARVTDMCVCVGPPDMIVKGSATVMVGGLPAARMGDNTAHGGVIVLGAFTVLIGDASNSGGGGAAPRAGGASASAGIPTSFPPALPMQQAATLQAAAAAGAPFCAICR